MSHVSRPLRQFVLKGSVHAFILRSDARISHSPRRFHVLVAVSYLLAKIARAESFSAVMYLRISTQGRVHVLRLDSCRLLARPALFELAEGLRRRTGAESALTADSGRCTEHFVSIL
jgi:hypothetical protein